MFLIVQLAVANPRSTFSTGGLLSFADGSWRHALFCCPSSPTVYRECYTMPHQCNTAACINVQVLGCQKLCIILQKSETLNPISTKTRNPQTLNRTPLYHSSSHLEVSRQCLLALVFCTSSGSTGHRESRPNPISVS